MQKRLKLKKREKLESLKEKRESAKLKNMKNKKPCILVRIQKTEEILKLLKLHMATIN
jgi:murein L,D-transpeptidase YafK